MAKRIPFNVIFVSDEDLDFPSNELNSHGPTVQGWRNHPESVIPNQEIILRLHNPAQICRIQVLAHQFLIPERIEIWIHFSPKGAPTTPSSQTFEYLGYISLSDNSATKFKSRELQSVSVGPQKGTHVKLRLGQCIPNHLNTNNQVALIAVNVIGFDIGSEDLIKLIENGTDIPLQSICDDLSFSMYVEESITDTVRAIEMLKKKAVNDERFEYARKLKLCMSALRSAGERMGRYALAKRQAVVQEDFIAAKLRKEQIEMYKNAVFSHLRVEVLMERDKVKSMALDASKRDNFSNFLPTFRQIKKMTPSPRSTLKSLPFHNHQACRMLQPPSVTQVDAPNSPQLNQIGRSPYRDSSASNSRTGSLRRRNKSAPRSSYEDYEERAVPALRHSHTNEFLRECQGAALLESDPCRGRSRLNERERRQAALPILTFGNDMVEMFYSRQYQDREDGLIHLTAILKGESSLDFAVGLNKIARSATLLLHRAVRDAVFSVFNYATETVRALFVEFVPGRVSASEVARCVDRLLPELLAKSGDPSPRIHTLAQHTILTIACFEQHLIAPALSRSVGTGTHPRLALSRLQMLEQLALSQGINADKQSGLTCRALSDCGCSGIHHPSEPVRKVAERVLLLVYKINPRLVRKQLPPDDDVTRRNLLYRQLFTEFDKLDMQRRKEMLAGSRTHDSCENSATASPKKSILLNKNGATHSDTGNRNRVTHQVPNRQNGKEEHNVKVKQTMALSAFNSNSFDDEKPQYCPFCDWEYNGAQDELDKHFWKACPILTKCPQCRQVLEVAALNAHLTGECDAKISYITCKRCTEAVHKDLYEIHSMEDHCKELKTNVARCPLCHDEVEAPLDGGWKLHLLGADGCRGNARRRAKI
ncbi:hypothetical protein HA402_014573 [Bradysia odoriphaga]|nr:hypothetical protein HA402_014573 [Bradysia odoriphaga]